MIRRLVLLTLAACGPSHPNLSMDGGQEIVLLPFPDDGGLTWDAWAGAFVRDYCVECHQPSAPCTGSGCHQAGDPALFDFHQQAAFVQRAATIRCGIATTQDPSWSCGSVAPKTYPIENGGNPLPVDAQRALVVAWIDAGCP
jgi:hypothetical protein